MGARERKDNIVGTIAEPRKGILWRAILSWTLAICERKG
jgi:hypothetical protein